MKNLLFITVLSLVCCSKNTQQQVYPPAGGSIDQTDIAVSKERVKNLNTLERNQIQQWIKGQNENFYPTQFNYWVNIEDFDRRIKREDDTFITYSYNLYDFDYTKIYENPVRREKAKFGHFDELKAVENALRLIHDGEEITLLVPSSLAYGTYGDEKRINNDTPLIIKLKAL